MTRNPQTVKSRKEEDFAKRSSLYQEFLAEREEILKHKDQLSKKLKEDIDFERALIDWIRNCRDDWRSQRRKLHHSQQDWATSLLNKKADHLNDNRLSNSNSLYILCRVIVLNARAFEFAMDRVTTQTWVKLLFFDFFSLKFLVAASHVARRRFPFLARFSTFNNNGFSWHSYKMIRPWS